MKKTTRWIKAKTQWDKHEIVVTVKPYQKDAYFDKQQMSLNDFFSIGTNFIRANAMNQF